MNRALATVGGAVIVWVAGLQAQQPQTPGQIPVFRSGTTIVQLDVVVTDKDGRPVRGLEKAEPDLFSRRSV